jgi:hypothetical protein
MPVWQLVFSSSRRAALLPDEGQRREAVRTLVKATGPQLALFSLVHEHKHAMVRKEEKEIKPFGGKVQRALNAVVEEPLGEPWIERVEGKKHLAHLLRYYLTQPSHHEVGLHDALWTGSCFLDLVGARIIDGLRLAIWDLLPGVPRSVVYKHVGLPAEGIEPVIPEQVRVLGAVRLVAAASAAFAADPLLRGQSRLVLRARAAAVHLGRLAEIPPKELRWALKVSEHVYYDAIRQPVDEVGLVAVRRRLALEEAVVRVALGIPGVDLGRRLGLCG